MDKEDLKKNAQHVEYHEHNAPVYNIPVGYVDKMINGNYYENHYADGTTNEGEEKKGAEKPLGQPKKNLFIAKDSANEEDVAATKREAERLKNYLKSHHLTGKKLTTRQGDTLNEIVVAFLKRWKDNELIGEQIPGAAVFRFLTEDVGIESEVSCESYAAKVKSFVSNTDVSIQREIEIGKCF